MLPSADQLFKDADFIFQQDLAPAHTAKSTKSWLNDYGVGVLDWPANSPELNPIENLTTAATSTPRDFKSNTFQCQIAFYLTQTNKLILYYSTRDVSCVTGMSIPQTCF